MLSAAKSVPVLISQPTGLDGSLTKLGRVGDKLDFLSGIEPVVVAGDADAPPPLPPLCFSSPASCESVAVVLPSLILTEPSYHFEKKYDASQTTMI